MSHYFKRAILLSVCMVLTGAVPSLAQENTNIRVGVYNFPPVAMVDHENQADGLLGDLLAELVHEHRDLTFQIIHTSPKRRHLDFRSGLFDVMFFENPNWSWSPEEIEISGPILRDEEVYVALNKDDRNQSFFQEISERRIVAIAGYHYGFARLETDSERLRANFDIELSHSHQRNLDLIKADRPTLAEVAIVSRSFLHTYFSRFPNQRDNFLVSKTIDQSYNLHVISRKEGPVSAQAIESRLEPLIRSGRYQQLVRNHGLQLPENLP